MMRVFLLIVAMAVCETARCEPEAVDTLLALGQVTVTASRNADVIPSQTLQGEGLKRLNSLGVADALRHFAGLQVKDYGGVGGVKTVNVRSMGSQHTGIVYDGVAIGNAQNGQVDLGQFSLDNVESLSVYNGQRGSILQPARDYASAATVYMKSKRPRLDDRSWRMRGTVRGGSFDLVNASVLVESRLGRRVEGRVSAEWLSSSGRYRFGYRRRAADGSIAYDTTATRHNGDIEALRVEADLYGTLTRGSWQAKIYTYNSDRGVPGAIVNNVWRRGERIGDSNTFVQGRYTATLGRFTSLNNIKGAYYFTHYINNDEAAIKVNNRYRQWEAYASTANMYEITRNWQASISYDLAWSTMDADMYRFARPTRYTHYLAVATAASWSRFKFQASVTGTFVDDHVEGREGTAHHRAVTPALFASVVPVASMPSLSLRAYAKQSYRMPTFNDLYYTNIGNASLKPERVSQANVGAAYRYERERGWLHAVDMTADVYYNYVTDKIVAYPKGQQFRWTMLNLGKVDIRGVDLTASIVTNPVERLELTLRGQYTHQRAIDITSRRDSYYRDQIPYVPFNSGSVAAAALWRQWGLNFTWIFVGERYNQPENIAYNYMPSWSTADVSLQREFKLGRVSCRAMAEVNNLAGRDYQVILNYPMPRRSYRVTLTVEL